MNEKATSFFSFLSSKKNSISFSFSRARARLASLSLSPTMPPTRLPLPVRPDVYPLLGALALVTAGALSFSFFTLHKTVKERDELQQARKGEQRR